MNTLPKPIYTVEYDGATHTINNYELCQVEQIENTSDVVDMYTRSLNEDYVFLSDMHSYYTNLVSKTELAHDRLYEYLYLLLSGQSKGNVLKLCGLYPNLDIVPEGVIKKLDDTLAVDPLIKKAVYNIDMPEEDIPKNLRTGHSLSQLRDNQYVYNSVLVNLEGTLKLLRIKEEKLRSLVSFHKSLI